MAAYGKPAPLTHGFDSTRSFSDPSFAYAAPPYSSQPIVSSVNTSSYQNASGMTSITYQPRTAYDDQSGPYLNVGSTPIPQVTSYQPSSGQKGTKFFVYITSLYELMTSNTPTFFLMFASRKCPAFLTKLDQQGAVCQYVVTSNVPEHVGIGWSSPQVPVSLLIESSDAELMGKVEVGNFTYLDARAGITDDASRKRKVSTDEAELANSPAKRASNSQLRAKEEYSPYGYTASDGAPFSPYLQPGSQYGMVQQQYGRPGQYQSQVPQRAVYNQQYSASSTSPPPNCSAQSPQISSWSPYSTVSSQVTRSPRVGGMSSVSRPISALPSPLSANPPLIRTSTLQQTPSPSATTAGVQQSGQPFNPYALFPHKAILNIVGDLDSMAENWSMEEWDSKRRIVMFKRSQSGSTITTTFKPVPLDDRPPSSVCISCIWWEEKNECFVTSVDTIYLLEQLVAARFTVEEKNRIRRNLEGFRPLTVSKAKADSEDFFKIIMAFPNPKPRNIEKDVKVFQWKILAGALKKIIGKYSASPSSTLPPALLTPVSSTGYTTEASSTISHTSVEHNTLMSPPPVSRTIPGSSTSTAYAADGLTRAISPADHKQGMSVAGLPDLRVSVPNYSHVAEPSSQWQGSAQRMCSAQFQHLGNASSRGSWDLSTYLDTSPTATSPGNPQPLNYNGRHVSDTPATIGSGGGGGGGGEGGGRGARVTKATGTAGLAAAAAAAAASVAATTAAAAPESERKKRNTRTST